jgi:hypothetical protein
MTTEPPKGLRANLMRMYNTLTDEGYARCRAQAKYQKLLFALAYFHSILLERRKFRWGPLGSRWAGVAARHAGWARLLAGVRASTCLCCPLCPSVCLMMAPAGPLA